MRCPLHIQIFQCAVLYDVYEWPIAETCFHLLTPNLDHVTVEPHLHLRRFLLVAQYGARVLHRRGRLVRNGAPALC